MNQNKDYDNKINEDELGPLKLKISPRRGLIVIGIIFIIPLLFFIIVKESPMACVPVAHAVTGELFGPLRLYLIEIWPDSKLMSEDGIKKGEIFLMPCLSKIEEFL